ncbi:unnamed protein product [Rotaria sp. Silwood1]|nr:unnamed protein product [Rotaria sp. Silwood1]CAF1533279.1 unnamed protein product [Rotaria sp. Silwood1]CAF1689886.1 unnamed protein product [Rotaria sp. Silwood1]CAF1689892.1 unnamed protein product [Rotaria sp. Silwood1]
MKILSTILDREWKQDGITVAGGNGIGDQLSQLDGPQGIFIDNDTTIYIADFFNHRIVQWRHNGTNGQVVAGGNEYEHETDRLIYPKGIINDKQRNSLIICDFMNRRVIRLSKQNKTNQQILISNIHCYGLAMDKNGSIYVSDSTKNEVRRWKEGDTNGTIVAGGNGKGNNSNQLNVPTYIFVDDNYSLYVSDMRNHRVMKWKKGAKEGIVVAGGNGQGDNLEQLSNPQGVIVDPEGQIYVADLWNSRVMRWCKNCSEGSIIIGEIGQRKKTNQFFPSGLSFDIKHNLYVADQENNRIQKFEIIGS